VFLSQVLVSLWKTTPSWLIQNTSCLLDLMAFQLRLFATLAIVLGVSGDASLHDCAGACPAQHVSDPQNTTDHKFISIAHARSHGAVSIQRSKHNSFLKSLALHVSFQSKLELPF
jgi:hypothetical protein